MTNQTQRITLTLQLKDAIIISQKSATEGMHESLDYIPGSNLLGAIASKLYAKLKQQTQPTAFELFHSGEVRFSNAYPMDNSTGNPHTSNPFPISWHKPKEETTPGEFFNLLHPKPEDSNQLKQERKGYLTSNKKHLTPTKHLHLKTAINKQTGTASEGQLFGYQSIDAGSTYQATIDIDNPETAKYLYQQIKNLKQIRVGRSKTAQYGRINITQVTFAPQPTQELAITNLKGKDSLILWLASDLIVYNQEGQPTLTPTLNELGLTKNTNPIELDTKRSWLRTRHSYSPYNGYRKNYDMEQQAISQGSLLVYPADGLDQVYLQSQLQKGIGCYTESGHGKIVSITAEWQFVLDKKLQLVKDSKEQSTTEITTENSIKPCPLVSQLQTQYDLQKNQQTLQNQVKKDLKDFLNLYKSARNYHGIPNHLPVGPTSTQWGRIRNEMSTKTFSKKEPLIGFLFNSKTGIIKPNDDSWSMGTTHTKTFGELLKDKINEIDLSQITLYLRSLAREAAHSPEIKQASGAQQ